MDDRTATLLLDALSSGIRLEVFRRLAKAGSAGMVAGEISVALELAPNTLSFHLKNMTHAGLLSVEQEGRYQRYRANIPLMLDVIGYLTAECCAGQPGQCAELVEQSNCPPAVLPPPK